MPDLVRGSSPLKIEFTVSLPHSLLATAALLCAAPQYEGLGDWLREARATLPKDRLDELCLLVTFPGGYQRFTSELIACLPETASEMDFDELVAYLEGMPAVHYQRIALRALARGAESPPGPAKLLDLLDDLAAWHAYLRAVDSEVAPEAVAALVREGKGLKNRLVSALRHFWQAAYAREYEATRPLMERSVAYHRTQSYSPDFATTFTAITGRLLPERIARLLPKVSRVTFIPSCYVGPYVAFTDYADQVCVYYNCRATPTATTPTDGAALYPPLKALADETRLQILALLQGREMYAQEIVDQLDISQPAVSRHLNLMAAAGVLKTRREGNAKYYSVDGEALARLADALRAFA